MRKRFGQFGPPYAVLNISRLGYIYFRIHFFVSVETKPKLIQSLLEHPNVGWLFEASGFFNVGAGFWARDYQEMNDISTAIRRQLTPKDRIVHQSDLTKLVGFGNRPEEKHTKPMTIVDSLLSPLKIHVHEFEFLKLLALDSGLSDDLYARILNLPKERIKSTRRSFEKHKVIAGYQRRTHYTDTYWKVFIDTTGVSERIIRIFLDRLWNDPRVLYLDRANNTYDLEFEIVVSSNDVLKKRYLRFFKVHQVAKITKSLQVNLLPSSKSITVFDYFRKVRAWRKGSRYHYFTPKLLYLDSGSARAYLNIFSIESYANLMKTKELALLERVAAFLKEHNPHSNFHVIDLGSGNGTKAKSFINTLGNRSVNMYYPLDIQPLELASAVRAHVGSSYEVHPIFLDFKKLSTRFPFRLLPGEKQLFLFLGGTYSNFPSEQINRYLKPLLNTPHSFLVISVNTRSSSVSYLLRAYANPNQETICFSPLARIGFKRNDFVKSIYQETDILQLRFEDGCVRSSFILKKDVMLNGKRFLIQRELPACKGGDESGFLCRDTMDA